MLLYPFIFLALIVFSIGCGIRTHNEVAHRAQLRFENRIYKEMIQSHQDAFQGGSPFPDWGYLCGHHDEGEEIHWPKLINRVAKYVFDQYGGVPSNWTSETRKLVTFLLGIESHHISDVLFHSIGGVKSGFIRENANICFKGVYQDGHDSGDIGGDFSMIHSVGMPNWMSDRWYIPSKDLERIYHMNGMQKVTAATLEKCSHLQFMLMMAIRAGGTFFYHVFAGKSPFLTERFFDYPIGGVDDMVLKTTQYWSSLIKIIETGTIPATINDFENSTQDVSQKDTLLKWFQNKYTEIQERFPSKIVKTERGAFIELIQPRSVEIKSPKDVKDPLIPSLSSYGHSIAIENNQLFVGAPGESHQENPFGGKIHHGSNVLSPPISESKFGSQIVFLDFNVDGIVDLVTSAPNTGMTSTHFYPTGAVFVYYGNSNGIFGTSPNVTIVGDFGTSGHFSAIGHFLSIGDVNMDRHMDLLIGSPYENDNRGSVTIYFAKTFHQSRYLNIKDASLVLRHATPNAWCGYSILVPFSGRVIVGCPITRHGTHDSVGTVLGYKFERNGLVPLFIIHGSDHFEQFGSALAFGNPFNGTESYLAVSSTAKKVSTPYVRLSAGSVCLISIQNLNGTHYIDKLSKKLVLESDRSIANFGKVIGFDDLNMDGVTDMYISEPLRDTARGNHFGRVYVLLGGPRFPTGIVKNVTLVSHRVLESQSTRSRFGSSLTSGMLQNKKTLVVGSPFDSSHSYFGGKVQVFTF